jgi:predicted nucleic acid-binding protein
VVLQFYQYRALARIQRLDLLPAIFESVLIPPAVAREIAPSIPILPAWLRVQAPNVPPPASLLRRRLGDGEWEALALAVELKADWIMRSAAPDRYLTRSKQPNRPGLSARKETP